MEHFLSTEIKANYLPIKIIISNILVWGGCRFEMKSSNNCVMHINLNFPVGNGVKNSNVQAVTL
jgi:hypothetical protein